jgi:uncharacterized membrane protein
MEENFKLWTIWLASGVEAGAAIIIGIAAIESVFKSLLLFARRRATSPKDEKETIRLQLSRWLALALEFELAADILRTAVAPTWNEIGQLAAIVVLRTALNYTIQKEIEKASEREHSAAHGTRAPETSVRPSRDAAPSGSLSAPGTA